MVEKSAYQHILEKAQEMMRRAEGREFREGDPPEGTKERLDYLEKVVHEFVQLNNKLLEKLGATPEEIKQAMSKPNPFLNERDANTMRFGREVLNEARRRFSQMSILLRSIKDRGEWDLRTGTKKVLGQSRRRKFRQVGGQDNWKRM